MLVSTPKMEEYSNAKELISSRLFEKQADESPENIVSETIDRIMTGVSELIGGKLTL